MAYQFFAKGQAKQQRTATTPSTPLSPPSLQTSSLSKQPPIHPPPLVLPQSTSSSVSNKTPSIGDPAFQPLPFTEPITSYQTPHPHITIDQVRTAHIPSLSRITGLLLPIRYPGSFYTACITDPVIASISRVAVYHDHPVTAGPTVETTFAGQSPAKAGALGGTDKVIGGIRCRLEKLPVTFAGNPTSEERPPINLYIQTLHLLSPHRGNGVAASLLHSFLFSQPPSESEKSSYRVSSLVKHYNIRTVTAHVQETNDDALKWYTSRGFYIEDGVVQGYYRRLNPGGARIVRFDLNWEREEAQNQESFSHSKIIDTKTEDGDEDDGWEKLEAEDDDADDHGIIHLADSRALDSGEDSQSTTNSVKRKRETEDDIQRSGKH
ncbi:hypothetical protein BGW36DRAFT_299738 [Talaromyces proteolyticus]|uniref:N-acetyltransferase domain-containing protein n=1 Tax=Talaromyces proteolyticus TaxID=1131652 RepID=A0AAD4PYQ5_9EURO|nr:uncharacterized protein BGW36DRAFT_299738 [Talaromyces proteolyticus]KAH8695052.1 hypothetical protein BGW36DRAFT_299738 [Talaromyces proteolyticus]